MRWDNAAFVNFTIIVDPDYFLESGLLAKQMVIPVDMRYHMEDKTNPGTFTEMFTTLTILRFELELPGTICTLFLLKLIVPPHCNIKVIRDSEPEILAVSVIVLIKNFL